MNCQSSRAIIGQELCIDHDDVKRNTMQVMARHARVSQRQIKIVFSWVITKKINVKQGTARNLTGSKQFTLILFLFLILLKMYDLILWVDVVVLFL